MMASRVLVCLVSSMIVQIADAAQSKSNSTFFIIGDYGNINHLDYANKTFDAMNNIVGNPQTDIDKAEFIVSCGDNLYPEVSAEPTIEEFTTMLNMFKRPNLAKLPVWAIRGNHDTYFNWTDELLLNMEQTQWQLPSFYYTKLVPAGSDGELMGLLFVDSILMLCSDYTAANLQDHPINDPELSSWYNDYCENEQWVAWGNSQYDWILQTMKEWDANDKIIWRATIQHYPMFPAHYAMSDFTGIVKYFLPLLQQHKFDLYLCGHEHLMAYAEVPKNIDIISIEEISKKQLHELQYTHPKMCDYGVITTYGSNSGTSRVVMQGESLHQVTTGFTGKSAYSICRDRLQPAVYKYAENTHWAWTQVLVTNSTMQLLSRGVQHDSSDVKDLYSLTISRVPIQTQESSVWVVDTIWCLVVVCLVLSVFFFIRSK